MTWPPSEKPPSTPARRDLRMIRLLLLCILGVIVIGVTVTFLPAGGLREGDVTTGAISDAIVMTVAIAVILFFISGAITLLRKPPPWATLAPQADDAAPQVLAYSSRRQPKPQQPPAPRDTAADIGKFLLATAGGTAASAVIWLAIPDSSLPRYIIIIVPTAKAALVVIFMLFRGWRSAAAGLLLSIPLGALIWIFGCFGAMSRI